MNRNLDYGWGLAIITYFVWGVQSGPTRDLQRGAVGFSQCPSEIETTGIVSNVIIPGCDKLPCIFHKGHSYPIEIDFETLKNTTTLKPEVYGILNGIVSPWTGIDPEGCKYMMIGACPLYPYDYVTWGYTLDVLQMYPTIDVIVRWKMIGDDGKSIFCFEFPVSVR